MSVDVLLQLLEEVNVYDHCQHCNQWHFCAPNQGAQGSESDHQTHHPGTTLGPICERCEILEVPKILFFKFCSFPYSPEETKETAVHCSGVVK